MTGPSLKTIAIGVLAAASSIPSSAVAEPVFLRNTPVCADASLITGRSMCGRYGSWALLSDTRVHVSLSVEARSLTLDFDTSGRRAAAAATSGTPASSGADAFGMGLGHRVAMGFARHFYTGLDFVIGEVALDRGSYRMLLGDGDQSHYVAGAGVGGLVLYLGGLSVRAEVLAGARLIGAVVAVDESQNQQLRARQSTTQAIVEPRLAAEIWLGPWMTLGLRAGSDLLRPNDVMFGVYLSLFSHAFDGSRHPR